MSELSESVLPLRRLLVREGALVERLADLRTWGERFDLLESVLLRQLGRINPAVEPFAGVLSEVARAKGLMKVADFSRGNRLGSGIEETNF